ncbi:4438_t:CDS:1, partial [Racocetra fulgida]
LIYVKTDETLSSQTICSKWQKFFKSSADSSDITTLNSLTQGKKCILERISSSSKNFIALSIF